MKFSVALIAKNESETLPRMMGSLRSFQEKGGEIILVDTGSTDDTVKIAKEMGCKVTEVGDRFVIVVDKKFARLINSNFIVKEEGPILREGDRIFNFAEARNFAASLAENNVVAMHDCDEKYTSLDIKKINEFIEQGFGQFEYNFVFSHDRYGNEAMKFVQSKTYDKTKLQWKGIVHEVLQPIVEGEIKRIFVGEDIIKLEHWQNEKTDRTGYLRGLAIDCFRNQENDRNSHYFARELMWSGRPKSAIKEFKRHIAMNRWPAEKAQSYIFMGDCYGKLGNKEKQLECYNKAFDIDGGRNETLLRIANYYKFWNNPQQALCYAKAATEVPWNGYYANNLSQYTVEPYEVMYWACGWLGRIAEAQKYLKKCLEFQPYNQSYLRDTKYYFEYYDRGIEGWMRFEELQFLYENAKKMNNICEIGSWKGRSTHALLSGCKGKVVAVDTFMGSKGEEAIHGQYIKDDQVYKDFIKNVGHFENLTTYRMDSLEAAKNNSAIYDMIFIDGEHTYEGVKADIIAWRDKCRILLCGHDYTKEWPGVMRAVNEELGEIDGVVGTIWYKWMFKPKVSIIIPQMGREERLQPLIKLIKENVGYENYEIIVEADNPDNRIGVPKTLKNAIARSDGKFIMYLGNDCYPQKDFLINALIKAYQSFPYCGIGLVGLNDTIWRGEVATHWLAHRRLLDELDGEFFHTGYNHIGCDNELTGRCRKMNEYAWAENAIVAHDHGPSKGRTDAVYEFAWNKAAVEKDRELLKKRSEELGFEILNPINKIPKRIFTIWLNPEFKMPEIVEKCVKSHEIEGYEHKVITLRNCFVNKYIKECLDAKQWVKAADYLRIHYLFTEGGIYLDADMEVLKGKNFDDMLGNEIFTCIEENGFIANSAIGAVAKHPLLAKYLNEVNKLDGSDNKIFENGMEVWSKLVHEAPKEWDIKVYSSEYFFPYNHQTGKTDITENSKVYHYFLKTWGRENTHE